MKSTTHIKIKEAVSLLILAIAGCESAPPATEQDLTPESVSESFEAATLLKGDLNEPMAFEVLPDGDVLIAERYGGVKHFDSESGALSNVATISVNTKYTNSEGAVSEAEEGLFGLSIHPDFERTPWVYLLYADPHEAKHVLARREFRDNALLEATQTVVLEFPAQRETCCHTGGGMTWDSDGNLHIATGNNTGNSTSAQTDERPGRSSWDDQRGAANTNDLRGKILRIHPEDDGSYTIPPGNLFPTGETNTRPEIYVMGLRNPWRLSVDSRTGYLYWGEVGPDAFQDSDVGPRGYDEFNQARGPGNFGWPYFVGDNVAFPYYDFASEQPLETKNPERPINASLNNTGKLELPPAMPAMIYYPYARSNEFPLMGEGMRSATGGPIFRKNDFSAGVNTFPDSYDGVWFVADFSRNWIMAIRIDGRGNYVSMERFMPDYSFHSIIDIKFGPDGALYVLEYGSLWFNDSPDDRLVKITAH